MMPFNTLLLNCLKSGTSFSENGVGVSIRPQSNETTLFFSIDEQSNPNSTFRKDLSINGGLCDLIIFHVEHNIDERVFCFVELKGGDTKHAVEQVINTFDAVKAKINKDKMFNDVKWKAYVLTTGSSHKDIKKLRYMLNIKFSKNYCDISTHNNLDEFIRKV